jgi:signal transduction histidine kinase
MSGNLGQEIASPNHRWNAETVTTSQAALLARVCEITTAVLHCSESCSLLWSDRQNAYVTVAHHASATRNDRRSVRLSQAAFAALRPKLRNDGVVRLDNVVDPNNGRHAPRTELYMGLATRNGGIVGVQVACGIEEKDGAPSGKVARHLAALASLALERAEQVELLEQSNRVKTDIIAIASHEVRDTLNSILIQRAVLGLGEGLSPVQAAALDRIDAATRQLAGFITNLLEVGRLELAKVPLDIQPVSLADLLDELVGEMRTESSANGAVQLVCNVAPDLPAMRSDPFKLRVVLKNLIQNALKFTSEGAVNICVFGHGNGIALEVTDTGTGITSQTLATLFDPYKRAPTSQTTGAGLGLYIVQRFLALLGGTVEVSSQHTRGATFRVWLPADILSSDGAGSPPPP